MGRPEMLAMQYSFVLPSDYDMGIIENRISEKGHLLDDFPNLRMKAYLSARKGDASSENIYGPFYLWNSAEGMSDFICGAGFAGLTQSFGWPSVMTWVVWNACLSDTVKAAKYASRQIFSIGAYDSLDELRKRDRDEAAEDVASGRALASVTAFEPVSWSRVRFQMYDDKSRCKPRQGVQHYDVGHVSAPGMA